MPPVEFAGDGGRSFGLARRGDDQAGVLARRHRQHLKPGAEVVHVLRGTRDSRRVLGEDGRVGCRQTGGGAVQDGERAGELLTVDGCHTGALYDVGVPVVVEVGNRKRLAVDGQLRRCRKSGAGLVAILATGGCDAAARPGQQEYRAGRAGIR